MVFLLYFFYERSKQPVLVDDMINKGGTMITALQAAGEYFPRAYIRSGKGFDRPGEWEQRKNAWFMTHLEGVFQDFADLSEQGKDDEAMKVYAEAEAYAKNNGVELQAGWHKRRQRIEARSKQG